MKAMVWLVATILIASLFGAFAPFDDSDSPPSRSGLAIRTDALTGCQYLATWLGSITPRMAADGRQVCK